MINTGTIMRTSIDDLTERISIVYQTTVLNERGNAIRSQDMVRCSVWAKVLPISARSMLGSVELEAEVTYRIVIRYRNDIEPNDQIIWNGKRMDLTAPPYNAESRRIWTVLECKEAREYGA